MFATLRSGSRSSGARLPSRCCRSFSSSGSRSTSSCSRSRARLASPGSRSSRFGSTTASPAPVSARSPYCRRWSTRSPSSTGCGFSGHTSASASSSAGSGGRGRVATSPSSQCDSPRPAPPTSCTTRTSSCLKLTCPARNRRRTTLHGGPPVRWSPSSDRASCPPRTGSRRRCRSCCGPRSARW